MNGKFKLGGVLDTKLNKKPTKAARKGVKKPFTKEPWRLTRDRCCEKPPRGGCAQEERKKTAEEEARKKSAEEEACKKSHDEQ